MTGVRWDKGTVKKDMAAFAGEGASSGNEGEGPSYVVGHIENLNPSSHYLPTGSFRLTPEQIKSLEDGAGGAVKADTDKLRLDLFPGDALFAISEILTFGANKYTDRNWEKGMKWSRPFGALMRHMWAWWQGEKTDAETGKSHLWHAGCCIVFLIAYEIRGIGLDDRPASK